VTGVLVKASTFRHHIASPLRILIPYWYGGSVRGKEGRREEQGGHARSEGNESRSVRPMWIPPTLYFKALLFSGLTSALACEYVPSTSFLLLRPCQRTESSIAGLRAEM